MGLLCYIKQIWVFHKDPFTKHVLPTTKFTCAIAVHISMIPQGIINKYNLTTIVGEVGWCYAEIQKVMYGLKESG